MPVEFRTGYFVECVDADDYMTAFVAGGRWRADIAWPKICVDTARLKWRGDVAWAKPHNNLSCATWSADETWVKRSTDKACDNGAHQHQLSSTETAASCMTANCLYADK
jgi:hypothetical protein